jgi:hypothetical protein
MCGDVRCWVRCLVQVWCLVRVLCVRVMVGVFVKQGGVQCAMCTVENIGQVRLPGLFAYPNFPYLPTHRYIEEIVKVHFLNFTQMKL